MVDESTSDEQPDMDNLVDIKNGTLKLNNSNVHILPEGTSIFKCLGHIYKVEEGLAYSQFLVIEKKTRSVFDLEMW